MIDHTCMNRACVNVAHLRAVNFATNVTGPNYDGEATPVLDGNSALPAGITNLDGNPDPTVDAQDFQRWRPAQ